MFVRGALLARRRQNLLDPLPGSRDTPSLSSQAEGSQDQENEESRLSQTEFDSLKAEDASRLKDQTKALNLVLLTCCVGAVVQGWSQASITGANLWWPCELLASGTTDSPPCQPSKKWAFNAVNAAAFFSACIGVWLSDFLNDMAYGRRGALMVAGTITFIASIWSGYTSTWIQLFGARFLLGIGYGAKASVVTIFESEVAPSKRRGRLLVSWQFFTATGLWLGTAANLIFHWNWRLQVSSSFIPCITFVALAWASSESPRWLIKKERYKEAFIVLRDLRGTDLQAARDLYFIYAQLRVEMLILAGEKDHSLADWRNYWVYRWALAKSRYTTRLQQIFSIPRNRRAALATASVLAAAGSKPTNSLWITFGWTAVNAICSGFAYRFVDSKGRRFLLLFSLISMVPLTLSQAFSLAISNKVHSGRLHDGIVVLFTYLNVGAYSPGAGVVPFLYSSEVFPLINREAGMSWSCFVNFLFGAIILFCSPVSWTSGTTESLGSELTKLFFIFAAIDFVAAVLVWFYVPETSLGDQSALEHMNYLFSIPTRAAQRFHALKLRPRNMRPRDESNNGRLPPTLDEWWKDYGRERYRH
ncbi:MFS general substrate transporter [Viridothelium virens]|uniref:MFS general substrate transporter n=1 Tax=Viridothelium virens TaxID=1048519 RepID=A0A6A6H7V5_VIRVR|nr:MFS general substrate transporter [Viridothelium virens]